MTVIAIERLLVCLGYSIVGNDRHPPFSLYNIAQFGSMCYYNVFESIDLLRVRLISMIKIKYIFSLSNELNCLCSWCPILYIMPYSELRQPPLPKLISSVPPSLEQQCMPCSNHYQALKEATHHFSNSQDSLVEIVAMEVHFH